MLGALFESLVTLSVRVYAHAAEATVHHLRTWDSPHEVDLIIQRADQRIVALEVKLSPSVSDDDVTHPTLPARPLTIGAWGRQPSGQVGVPRTSSASCSRPPPRNG